MIVDPDFFDHWKTLLLIDSLDGDQAAPLYVLRLWAHCQNRRQWTFSNLSDVALKALCRYPGHPKKLVSALTASGYVSISDCGELTVNGWVEYNSQLIANWKNGAKGGRPKGSKPRGSPEQKPPPENPSETHGFSMGNPSVTHPEPIGQDRSSGDENTRERAARARDEEIPEDLDTPEFRTAWRTWCDWILTQTGREPPAEQRYVWLGDLQGRGADKAVRDINYSISCSATMLYDSDRQKRSGGGKSKRQGVQL